MATFIAMHRRPADPAAFDQHYFGVHAPLAKQLPGLTGYEISHGDVLGADWYLVAILTFESYDALVDALQSDIGKSAQADLANFAQAGVEIIYFDNRLM